MYIYASSRTPTYVYIRTPVCVYILRTIFISVAVEIKMAHVAVRCENNTSKRYDGRVWLETVECIVERNGKAVTQPLDATALKQGDAVES